MIRRCTGRLLVLTAVLVAAGLVDVGAGSVARAAGSTVDVPATIDATGGTDVTGALNAFLATVPDDTTVRFAPRGRYRIDGTVVLQGARGVVVDGRKATLTAPTDGRDTVVDGRPIGARRVRSRSHLVILDGSGITVRQLAVEGPNESGRYRPALEAQAGVLIRRSRDITIEEVDVRATFGDGIYIAGRSSDITIRGCLLEHNGRQGVAVVAGEQVTVEGCTIAHTGRSAIDLEPALGPAAGIRIVENRVVDATNAFVAAIGARDGVRDVVVERNRVVGGRGLTIVAGVPGAVRSGFRVVDNVAEGTSRGLDGVLMSFTRYDGVVVRGNRQAVARGVVPVQLTNTCRAEVADNEFGAAAAAPVTNGDCTAPGLVPARPPSTTRPTGERRSAGGSPGRARPQSPGTQPATPPATVVVTRTEDTPVAATAVIAFAAGAAAGAGGVLLVRRTRRNSAAPSVPGREDGATAPSEGEGR